MHTFIISLSFYYLCFDLLVCFLEEKKKNKDSLRKTFKHGGVKPKLIRSHYKKEFADPAAIVVLSFIPSYQHLSLCEGRPADSPCDRDDDVLVISQIPLMEHKAGTVNGA